MLEMDGNGPYTEHLKKSKASPLVALGPRKSGRMARSLGRLTRVKGQGLLSMAHAPRGGWFQARIALRPFRLPCVRCRPKTAPPVWALRIRFPDIAAHDPPPFGRNA